MTRLPARLSRKAVKQFFNKVPAPKWAYWFEHEKTNGLHELRVAGPFKKAYYDSEGVRDWLLSEGVYKPEDFDSTPPHAGNSWSALAVRKHALAA